MFDYIELMGMITDLIGLGVMAVNTDANKRLVQYGTIGFLSFNIARMIYFALFKGKFRYRSSVLFTLLANLIAMGVLSYTLLYT